MSRNYQYFPADAEPFNSSSSLSISKSGYEFNPSSQFWRLDKDTKVNLELLPSMSEETRLGFVSTLQRYAEEMSAKHVESIIYDIRRFMEHTGSDAVTSTAIINWRSSLTNETEWHLGRLRSFLYAWYDYGFVGMSEDVVTLLESFRLKGGLKGVAITTSCPYSGPYTDIEMAGLINWLHDAIARQEIELETFSYLITLIYTARRPVNIWSLRSKDLLAKRGKSGDEYTLSIPRAKQRGGTFRQTFRALKIDEDLYLALKNLCIKNEQIVSAQIGQPIPESLVGEIPIYLNPNQLSVIRDEKQLHQVLLGSKPDMLHATRSMCDSYVKLCARKCTVISERTGDYIHLNARRMRYTRGTNIRREGFGASIIAELLDHSDTQNVKVYTENTANEAAIIDKAIGAQLAPFAQACMGTLIASERDAIRGKDPSSRIPNQNLDAVGNCGSFGFCSSGYKACYTCTSFQPWIDGPHEDVLAELYLEKEQVLKITGSVQMANINDRLILAVEDCVARCKEAKNQQVLNRLEVAYE